MDTGYLRPEPDPGPDTRPYWEGLKAGEFLVQQCMSCGRKRHYPRPVCDACYSLESEWVPIRGQGRIHSWTVCHHAFLPGFRKLLPYVVAIADIDDGHSPIAGGADSEFVTFSIEKDLSGPAFRSDLFDNFTLFEVDHGNFMRRDARDVGFTTVR